MNDPIMEPLRFCFEFNYIAMKTLRIALITLFAALFISSCSRPLENRIDSFVSKTEANCASYSQADWEKSIKEYEALVQEYKDNYDTFNKEQKEKINSAIGKYSGILLKQGIDAVSNSVQNAVDIASSFLKGVKESIGVEE